MVRPTMSTSIDKRESFHYMIENITKVEQHTIRFLKHPMFPPFLVFIPSTAKSLAPPCIVVFRHISTHPIDLRLEFGLGLCSTQRPVM